MKTEVTTKVCSSGVLKKLWSYIKPKSNCITILINIKMECDEREKETGELDVEVLCKTKTELIRESVLLKNFKAMEPEI
ncbi:MAG: hypothetical protein KA163_07190 [Bacteroidia bacterium]|nr:hypothetical protein [Bacteroidia bacterium]